VHHLNQQEVSRIHYYFFFFKDNCTKFLTLAFSLSIFGIPPGRGLCTLKIARFVAIKILCLVPAQNQPVTCTITLNETASCAQSQILRSGPNAESDLAQWPPYAESDSAQWLPLGGQTRHSGPPMKRLAWRCRTL
jgi:hypothetical protein